MIDLGFLCTAMSVDWALVFRLPRLMVWLYRMMIDRSTVGRAVFGLVMMFLMGLILVMPRLRLLGTLNLSI